MSLSGQHSFLRSKPNFCLKTLLVLIILLIIFFIFYLENSVINIKPHIVYPGRKGTQKEIVHQEATEKQPGSSLGTTHPTTSAEPHLACGVPVQSGPMIKVAHHKAYVIGSYVEHRFNRKMIRTVSIVFRSEQVQYYCLLCCDGRNISAAASLDIHSDHFEYDYGTADIICQVPITCTTPTYVAITSRTHEGGGSAWNIQSFQPVGNQQPRTENFPYDFTVCLSVMYNYTNVLRLVQTMEMFKLLGVQKVAIYKTSCYPDTQKVLDYYVKQGFVDIIPWNMSRYINVARGWKKSISPGDLEYYGQIVALNDCVYRYMYESHYVALQDLDELILPLKQDSWTALIPQLEMMYQHNAGFEFENNIFPLSLFSNQKPENTPALWKQVEGENILPHVYRIPVDPKVFNNFKVIANPRLVFKATAHGLLHSMSATVRVDSKIARMYHIKNYSSQYFSQDSVIEDTRLWDYSDKLIPAVSEVLRQALNIPSNHGIMKSYQNLFLFLLFLFFLAVVFYGFKFSRQHPELLPI
ncbi:uncharacterized protein LOC118817858 isoform X1 [Colossoma macropomum]|uniref:uncharacterized protein LOC118817858 isoform X1 n=2 Tax=Colossoma macropomum TaxID=42526 RepID=UPI001864CE7A|nr:uncharacterized protein LOC118817858 isoform X1 [Colossoma macropomum]